MYIEITFQEVPEDVKDILIARIQHLAEGFEETGNDVKAIFLKENYDAKEVANAASVFNIKYSEQEIAQQNWNKLWESNFDPVIVDDFVGIRASFHAPLKNVQHEIVITPKMSFGTGHHATTYLMIQQMRKQNFINKSVFDFGTGTGVLAILAQKLGAATITANDIDEWSIENAKENFENNASSGINLIQSDSAKMEKAFDIILANINRNVLLHNMANISQQLHTNGVLILSGILQEDETAISKAAAEMKLILHEKTEKNKWISMSFKKNI